MDETRSAIVGAATELIRAGGLAAASVSAIARAADVAPATVRNHFPDQRTLATAVGPTILEELRLPDADIFEGLSTTAERVERLAHELVGFFERGQAWWQVYSREAALAPAWEATEALVEERLRALVGDAIGPLADDRVAVAVVASVIGSPLHYALLARGLSPAEAVESSIAMIVPWLEARTVA